MLAWELCMDVLGYEVMQGILSKGYICFLAASLALYGRCLAYCQYGRLSCN